VTRGFSGPTLPDEWDQAVRQSRDTWLYHLSRVAPLFLPPHSQPPIFIECRWDGRLVGGAILVVGAHRWHGLASRRIITSFIGPLSVSPFVVDGLSPKVSEAALDQVVDACVTAAEDLRCEELLLFDTVQSRRCLEDRPITNRYYSSTGWTYQVAYHYLLDLRQDLDTLWSNVASTQRGSIRRARERLEVVPGSELDGGREAYAELLDAVFRREGVASRYPARLREVFDAICAGGNGQAFFCLEDKKPCAVAGIARFGNCASYQHAARTDKAMNGAASLGLWAGIEWAKSVGCEWFDLNGLIFEKDRKRSRSIAQFKKSFGGGVIEVHGVKREFRPLARATYAFVDAWGVEVKRWIRRATGREKAPKR
jgi:hypothetical protein